MSEQNKHPLNLLCDAFRTRLALLLARAGLARVISLGIGLFAGLLLLDWRLHLESPLRLLALLAFVTVLAMAAWFTLVRPLGKRWSDAEALAHVDATVPASQGMLLDLYELTTARERIPEVETEHGRQLAQSAAADLQALVARVPLAPAFDTRPANRWLAAVLVLGLLLTGVGLAFPDHLAIGSERLFNPFSRVRWPHRTTITLHRPDTGWTVPQLESFTIAADVTGEVPARVTLSYRTAGSSSWVREKLPVQANGDEPPTWHVSHTFPEVREPVEFILEGGDYRTDRQEIAVIQRPFLKSITAHYSYPAYAGLPDRSIASGQLAGLEGTKVRLVFDCSMPLERAVFTLTPEEPGAAVERSDLNQLTETTFEKTMLLERSGRYAVELYERNGYREARPEVYEVRVTPDDPPEVELLAPGKDLLETRQASVEVAFRARDKLGLARLEFLYQLNDDKPVVLSDRITGPIPQTGTDNTVRFTWELRRMDLPESANLRYFVRVQDNNPTGRGKVESPPGQIKLVKPTEFHLEALERAKVLEEEARIAWRNQLQAWRLGGQWLETGTGAEDDKLWAEMQETQQKSFQAAKQIKFHLQALIEKYERNHMAQDFMAGRLSVVGELLRQLLEKEHSPIADGLAAARPRSSADAAPDRLKTLRGTAAGKFKDHQKMAVLVLERMLRKLYDWRDLQICAVTTKLLHEQQEEVLDRTQKIAPKTIAKEIEDLNDRDQERVLTLGKQQRAIFDTESGLENQITYLMYKAERQARKTILEPLQAAFRNLRDNRVNHHLKRAAELIENNQPAQILDNQKAAMRALQVVLAGLVQAGQKVDKDESLALAMAPSEEGQFDPDQIKPTEVAKQPDPTMDVKPVEPVTPVIEVPTLPEGTDALSAAVRLVVELEDNVLGRSRYLDKNRGPGEMPRFLQLKRLRLSERQEAALNGLDQALKEAAKKGSQPAQEVLTGIRERLTQLQKLIAAAEVGPGVQQMQADAIEGLKDLLQYLALAHAVEDAIAENKRLGGVDAFNRKYFLRDKDLDLAVALLLDLNHARQVQAGVLRELERFHQHPPVGQLQIGIEGMNRQQAVASQQRVAGLIDGVAKRLALFTPEVASRVQQTGVARLIDLKLGAHAERIAPGKADAELLPALRDAAQALGLTVQTLRDLLEERVRIEPKVVASKEPPRMTLEQFNQMTSRENLARLLKDETSLPPELREKMIRALEKEFPPKYRQLLQSYYGSFVTPKKETKE